ncbi:EthD domain-containing protein [Novosphingobium sp.]|uniref:EthD domain-containing protein n=1 Tax=Novosphingobium sp. TaxID=1874826 RepID=UPI003D096457
MEKVIAALWAPADEPAADYAERLLRGLPGALRDAGVSRVRINVRDADVAAGAALVQSWQVPQQDAIVQFWLPSANARFRGDIDAALAAHSAHFALYLVAESTIIANTDHAPQPGQRTWGWSQASFITFRPDMARAAAIDHWHGHHTRVAIETQSNFEYVQNLIVRPLTAGAPAYDAFVEECFPATALDQPQVFFDAVGNQPKFEANLATMMDSCAGFIDFARVDVMPTSQYDFGAA